jgi:fatty-acyl-CoA synthase
MDPIPSHVFGNTDQPLQHITIGELLAAAAGRYPGHDAVVVCRQHARLTYLELDREVTRLAGSLVRLGLTPGDRLGIWSPNRLEWLLLQFATARAGIVLVNINPAYRLSELGFALRKVGVRVLVLASAFKSSDYIEMMRSLLGVPAFLGDGRIACGEFPVLEWLVHLGEDELPGFLSFRTLLELSSGPALPASSSTNPPTEPTAPINVQFTSGTTGLPKGATLTHFNILNNGFFVGEGMRLTPQDRLCIPVPLYHCFGMVLGVMAAVTHGACMVFPGEAFDPIEVLEAVEAERCTALHGVPTMFIAELEHPRFREFDLSSLRTGIMAGAPCPIEVMRRVIDEMHMHEITICYGMTETSPVSFQSLVDDPLDKRIATVGRVHPHVEVKIVDSEGETVPVGVTGELCTRGYSVMKGYWDDPERTAEVIDGEGWMHTGDLAALDDEGYCRIVGRLKDMIIRGGENVYPREVEEFLYQHPKIREVAVVGVPDRKYGEEVCAVIHLHDGVSADAEEIRMFCRGQIAHHKIPRYVRFVDAFPMTITGKIQKFLLRAELNDILKDSIDQG